MGKLKFLVKLAEDCFDIWLKLYKKFLGMDPVSCGGYISIVLVLVLLKFIIQYACNLKNNYRKEKPMEQFSITNSIVSESLLAFLETTWAIGVSKAAAGLPKRG